jgi:hypothetical protein
MITSTTGECRIDFGDENDANIGNIRYDHNTNAMRFITNTDEAVRIDSSGNLLVNSTSAGALASSGRGLIDVDGTSDSAIELKAGGSTYGYLYASSSQFRVANLTANPVTFFTSNTERMRIDGSGNVGIGTASPNTYGLGIGRIVTSYVSSGTQYALFSAVGSGTGGGEIDFGNHTVRHAAVASLNGSALAFYTNGANSGSGVSERMRIDSSGNLLVGTTVTTVNTTNFGTRISSAAAGYLASYRDVSGSSTAVLFGGNAGQVYVRGDGDLQNTNNSYGAISDERFKSDIVDASSQIDDIMAVQVRSYTLNETGATHIGVVAQELEASGMSGLVKTDDEGMKSVKYSILYMKAIKALQEAVTRIETLEAEVMALKGE